jgi:hypothetical protein
MAPPVQLTKRSARCTTFVGELAEWCPLPTSLPKLSSGEKTLRGRVISMLALHCK